MSSSGIPNPISAIENANKVRNVLIGWPQSMIDEDFQLCLKFLDIRYNICASAYANIIFLVELREDMEERIRHVLSDYTQMVNQVGIIATLTLGIALGAFGSLLGNIDDQPEWKKTLFVSSIVATSLLSVAAVIESFFLSIHINQVEAKFTAGVTGNYANIRAFDSDNLIKLNDTFTFIMLTFFLSFITFGTTMAGSVYLGLGVSNSIFDPDNRLINGMGNIVNVTDGIRPISEIESDFQSTAFWTTFSIVIFYGLLTVRFLSKYIYYIHWKGCLRCVLFIGLQGLSASTSSMRLPIMIAADKYNEIQHNIATKTTEWLGDLQDFQRLLIIYNEKKSDQRGNPIPYIFACKDGFFFNDYAYFTDRAVDRFYGRRHEESQKYWKDRKSNPEQRPNVLPDALHHLDGKGVAGAIGAQLQYATGLAEELYNKANELYYGASELNAKMEESVKDAAQKKGSKKDPSAKRRSFIRQKSIDSYNHMCMMQIETSDILKSTETITPITDIAVNINCKGRMLLIAWPVFAIVASVLALVIGFSTIVLTLVISILFLIIVVPIVVCTRKCAPNCCRNDLFFVMGEFFLKIYDVVMFLPRIIGKSRSYIYRNYGYEEGNTTVFGTTTHRQSSIGLDFNIVDQQNVTTVQGQKAKSRKAKRKKQSGRSHASTKEVESKIEGRLEEWTFHSDDEEQPLLDNELKF
jgi:hypothetical protein